MTDLTSMKCVPCKTGEGKLSMGEIKEFLPQVTGWLLIGDEIKKEYKFKNFKDSMEFIKKVAEIAENESHHPDIFVSYNKVILTLTTHMAKSLTKNDFIMAAKINKLKI